MIVGRRLATTSSNGTHRLPPTGNHANNAPLSPTKGWVEYGSIDDAIIEKLKDDEDVRVRLQVGAI